jgi:O-6-methylguanine DNA methyltransferase
MRTGELESAEAGEVRQHLSTCSSCDESVADVGELAQAVKSLATAPPRSCREAVTDHYDAIEVGGQRIWVAFSSRGLTMIHAGGTADEFRGKYCDRLGRELEQQSLPARLRKSVAGVFSGNDVEAPPVDLSEELTEFERRVLEVLQEIPRGEVRTYSWVAARAGRPNAVRAVGTICARNVVPFVVPCHRVVPTTGGVGDYAFGSPMKRALLEKEGVPVDELERLARRGVRYIGSKTTKIFCVPACHDALRIREENRVAFHEAGEAFEKGFRPCRKCHPVAA